MTAPQDATPAVCTRSFRFLDLPESIRVEIYKLVLGSREVTMTLNRRSTVTDCVEKHLNPTTSSETQELDVIPANAQVVITSQNLYAHWILAGEVSTNNIISIFSGQNKTQQALAGPCWLCNSDPAQGDAPCLSRTRRLEVQLLRVCRTIYHEAADELYRSTKFMFYRHEVLKVFLMRTSKQNLASVRHITLLTWRKCMLTENGALADTHWTDCLNYLDLTRLEALQHLTVVQLGRRQMRDGFGELSNGFTEHINNIPVSSPDGSVSEDESDSDSELSSEEGSDHQILAPPVHLLQNVPRKRIQVQEARDVLVGLQEEILLFILVLTDRALADPDRKRSLTVSYKAATFKPFNTFDLKWAVELTKENSETIQKALSNFAD